MTQIFATNGAAGDFNATGSYSGAALPISNDELIFRAVLESFNFTTNPTALAAVDLDVFATHIGFNGDIGAISAPYQGSADKVYHGGGGCLYYLDGGGTTDLWIGDASRVQRGVLNGVLTGNTITKGSFARGNYQINLSGTMATLETGWRTNPINDVILAILGGTYINSRLGGGDINASVSLGTVVVGRSARLVQAAGGATLLDVHGTCYWDSRSDPTFVRVHPGGYFDTSRVAGEITITAGEVLPGGRAYVPDDYTNFGTPFPEGAGQEIITKRQS